MSPRPIDGDSDGRVFDGTPRERPAPPAVRRPVPDRVRGRGTQAQRAARLRRHARTYRQNYPATVAEILDGAEPGEPGMRFERRALKAVKDFAKAKPYRGTLDERKAKIVKLVDELGDAYGLEPVPLMVWNPSAGTGYYRPDDNTIHMDPDRLSVVTLLHEFSHARGFDERKAVKWSVNMFKRVFPRSYSRLDHSAHMLVRRR